jgi:hypothetical protein
MLDWRQIRAGRRKTQMVKRGFTAPHRNQTTVVEVEEPPHHRAEKGCSVCSNMKSTLIELCIMNLCHEDRPETDM